ncbi:MAG TPA: hypothetical protein VFI42_14985 [Thermomicrobiaceae bacterium]|nr:hypothetical protein [Thermomicrobiaceae bacterium]
MRLREQDPWLIGCLLVLVLLIVAVVGTVVVLLAVRTGGVMV